MRHIRQRRRNSTIAPATRPPLSDFDSDLDTPITPAKRKSDVMDDGDMLDKEFLHSIGSQIVTLLVGKDKESIQADKSLLCKHVPFFQAAFNGNWKEAKNQSIDLLDEEPASVRAFLLWIYAGASSHTLPKACLISYEILIKIFLMAEKWTLIPLQGLVYRALYDEAWQLKDEQACYQHWLLAGDSQIRLLPLIHFVWLLGPRAIGAEDPESLKSEMDYDAEFLKDVLLYRLRLGTKDPRYPISLEELNQKPL